MVSRRDAKAWLELIQGLIGLMVAVELFALALFIQGMVTALTYTPLATRQGQLLDFLSLSEVLGIGVGVLFVAALVLRIAAVPPRGGGLALAPADVAPVALPTPSAPPLVCDRCGRRDYYPHCPLNGTAMARA